MASPVLGLSLREALALGVRPPLVSLRVCCVGLVKLSAPSPVVALSLWEALPLGVRRLSASLFVCVVGAQSAPPSSRANARSSQNRGNKSTCPPRGCRPRFARLPGLSFASARPTGAYP